MPCPLVRSPLADRGVLRRGKYPVWTVIQFCIYEKGNRRGIPLRLFPQSSAKCKVYTSSFLMIFALAISTELLMDVTEQPSILLIALYVRPCS